MGSNETSNNGDTHSNSTALVANNDTTSNVNFSFNEISVPARAFQNITDNETGIVFSHYSSDILCPLRLNQSENDTYKAIGSGVISAAVAGHNIRGLNDTNRINISMSILVSVS